MNYFVFIIKSAMSDFARNKGRTFLTSLGILIGVFSVVLLTALGLGLKKYIDDQFKSLGSGLIRVLPGQLLRNGSFQTSAGLGSIRFDRKDLQALGRLKLAELTAPIVIRSTTVAHNGKTEAATLYASTAEIFPALNLQAAQGTLFTKTEVEKRSKVVVVGPKISVNVGDSLKLEGQSFKVLGILEPKGGGGFGGPDLDTFVYLPYTAAEVFNPDKKFSAFIVKAREGVEIEMVKEEIKTLFSKRYKTDDFSVIDQAELLGAINSIFNILNLVLTAIAAISLVVGGIGIMNIMYVAVTERTREVGIRRAIGARAGDILWQFLAEAVILSLLGGLVGLLLAYIATVLIRSWFPAYVSAEAVVLALGVSSVIGIVFGVFPARKAANLSPIEAIRYE